MGRKKSNLKSKKKLSAFEKGQIIQGMKLGMTQINLANQLNRHQSTISKFMKKYEETGTIDPAPKSGRPRKTTPITDRHLVSLAKRYPDITAPQIIKQLNLQLCPDTVISRIKEKSGLGLYFQSNKPAISKKQAKKRLAFARKYIDVEPEFWYHVLYSDESPFTLSYHGRKKIWQMFGVASQQVVLAN